MTKGAAPMDRRHLMLSLMGMSGLPGCGDRYPADFSLEWDEEVALHDGRVILVHIRRYFWRRNQRVQWNALYMGTDIEFDMGPPRGLYRRNFPGYQVIMIDRQGSDWYLELIKTGGGVGPRPALVDERFPVLIVSDDGSERAATSWRDVPSELVVNIQLCTDDFDDMSRLNGKVLKLSDKRKVQT